MLRKTIAAGALVAAFAGAAAAQPVVLKFSSFEPPQAPITGGVFIPWAKDVSDASGGTLRIEVFAGGTLGRNPLQQLKLVQDGVADMAWTVPGYTPGRFDDTEVVELPFTVATATEGSLALTRMHAKALLGGFDDLKLLLIGTTPAFNIHGKFPMKTVADLKGKRLRTGSPQIAKLAEAVGAVPVQIGAPQTAESLARGVIDGSLNEWNFVATFKIDEVVNHHLVLPMGTVAVMVPMLKSKYDALPAQAKAALDRYSGEAMARRFCEVVDRTNTQTLERVSKSGKNTVVVPAAGDQDAWRRATLVVTETWRKAKPGNERIYQALVEEVAAVRSGK